MNTFKSEWRKQCEDLKYKSLERPFVSYLRKYRYMYNILYSALYTIIFKVNFE